MANRSSVDVIGSYPISKHAADRYIAQGKASYTQSGLLKFKTPTQSRTGSDVYVGDRVINWAGSGNPLIQYKPGIKRS
jgi:hypothetical protein